ncbi:unnamed protein product [Moneuplotes crassus]|uniref:Uncharacterized protein n=1 Tax=Euplotes crassus TaxID=5936 RepID=A0AAD1TYW2_EUPCR|nr:unnamed protein product [Moneuplotes crassus]
MTWVLSKQIHIHKNAIAVHSSEANLIASGYSECNIVKIDGSTGTITEQLMIGSAVQCASLTFSNDNSNIYVTGKFSSTPHIFKLGYADFSSTTISSASLALNSVYSVHSYLNSGQEFLVISGSITSPSQAYSLISVEYETSTQMWSKKLQCPSACVITGTNNALVVNSLSKVFNFFSDTKPLMVVTNLSDGSLVGSYIAGFFQSGLEVSGTVFSTSFNKVFILIKYDNGAYKIEYDPAEETFSNSYISTTIIPGWILEVGGHTIIGSGVPSDIQVIGISRLASNGIYGINTAISFTSVGDSFTSTIGYSYTSDVTIYVSSSLSSMSKDVSDVKANNLPTANPSSALDFVSEVIFQGGDYILNTTIGTSGNIGNFFPCSITGATSVSSTIEPHSNGQPKPSWVTIGGDSLSFDYSTPLSGGGQTFYFTGKSIISGQVFLRNVEINIAEASSNPTSDPVEGSTSENCKISHCQTCSSSVCTVCSEGYSLTNLNTCVKSSGEAKIDGSLNVNFSLVISGFVGAITSSMVSGIIFQTSSQNIWALLNQYQLFLMIPFLIVKLPSEFRRILQALQFSFVDMNFLNSKSLQGVKKIIDQIDYENPYNEFCESEYESGSAFVNCLDIIVSLCGIIFLNLIAHLSIELFCKQQRRGSSSKVYRLVSLLFYFKFYLRFLLESFLFICLVSVSEFFRVIEAKNHPLSYCLNFGIIILLLAFVSLVFSCYAFLKNPHKNNYISELFEGLKLNKFAQIHSFIFLARRVLVVLIIVSMRNAGVISRLCMFICLQFFALSLTVFFKPHDTKAGNIVEIINEACYFAIILLIICIQNTKSVVLDEILNRSIFLNTFMVLCVSLANLLYLSIRHYLSKKRRNKIKPITKKVMVQTGQNLNEDKNHPHCLDCRPNNLKRKIKIPETTNSSNRDMSIFTDRKLMTGGFGRLHIDGCHFMSPTSRKGRQSSKKVCKSFKDCQI